MRVWRLAETTGGVSPTALARRLVREGCHEVLVESGAKLGTSWFRAGLVYGVAMFVAPRMLGGEGLDWCGPLGIGRLDRARSGRIVESSRGGDDLFVRVAFGG